MRTVSGGRPWSLTTPKRIPVVLNACQRIRPYGGGLSRSCIASVISEFPSLPPLGVLETATPLGSGTSQTERRHIFHRSIVNACVSGFPSLYSTITFPGGGGGTLFKNLFKVSTGTARGSCLFLSSSNSSFALAASLLRRAISTSLSHVNAFTNGACDPTADEFSAYSNRNEKRRNVHNPFKPRKCSGVVHERLL